MHDVLELFVYQVGLTGGLPVPGGLGETILKLSEPIPILRETLRLQLQFVSRSALAIFRVHFPLRRGLLAMSIKQIEGEVNEVLDTAIITQETQVLSVIDSRELFHVVGVILDYLVELHG